MAEKGSVLDRILTGVLVAAAVAVAGVAVRRELSSDGAVPRSASVAGPAGDSLTDPSSLERAARPLSTRRGKVRVVVFTDLECPACRTFHRSLMEHTASDAADVDVALVHFPLPQHRFASMAAAMAECAAAEGRFRPMVEVLFASQDSLGLKSWPRLATEAGLREPGRILSCIEGSEARTAVAEGKRLGERLAVQVTPTVIIDGWRLARTPSHERLGELLRAAQAGRIAEVLRAEGR